MRETRWFWVLMILALLIGTIAVGCGGPDDTAPDTGSDESAVEREEDPIEEADVADGDVDAGENFNDWIYLESVTDLVNMVQEMTWKIDGGLFHYVYQGSETVDGVSTDVISMEMEGEEVSLWIDSSGEVKQAVLGGEEMPAEMLDFMGMYLITPLIPFQFSMDADLQSALTGHDVPGWNVTRTDNRTGTVGGKAADLYTMEIQGRDPSDAGAGDYTMEFRFADFGDSMMLLGWNVLEGAGEDEQFMEFVLESIVFR